MSRFGKALNRWFDCLVRMPWFVLAWLALACHIALRSLAAVGSSAAVTSSLRTLGFVARLAAWAEWPLPVAVLLVAAWRLLRCRRAVQQRAADEASVAPDLRAADGLATCGPPGPGHRFAASHAAGGASLTLRVLPRDLDPRQVGPVSTERRDTDGPVG